MSNSVQSRLPKRTRGLLLGVSLTCFILSWFALQASSQFSGAEHIRANLSEVFPDGKAPLTYRLNPFYDSQRLRRDSLALDVKSLDEQIGYMYFDRERDILLDQVLGLVRQQINVAPYNERYWDYLVHGSAERNKRPADFMWALERASLFLRWNDRSRAGLAQYCVEDYHAIVASRAQPCVELISNFPFRDNINFLSQRIKIKPAPLLALFDQLGIPYSK